MKNSKTTQSAEKNTERYFRKADRSETTVKRELKKERAATAAKTANLRELRLAKEAAEKLDLERSEKG